VLDQIGGREVEDGVESAASLDLQSLISFRLASLPIAGPKPDL
jgi:hypothetical protein